jgi:hypothetical protein
VAAPSRSPKLNEDDIEAAKAMLANPDIGVTQIARRLGVTPATLYRYIAAAPTGNLPGVCKTGARYQPAMSRCCRSRKRSLASSLKQVRNLRANSRNGQFTHSAVGDVFHRYPQGLVGTNS